MGVSVFPVPASAAGGALTDFSVSLVNGRGVIEQSFPAGIYTLTSPSASHNVVFYDDNGSVVQTFESVAAVTTLSMNLGEAAVKVMISSSVAGGGLVFNYVPKSALKTVTITQVTSSQTITTATDGIFYALGGGGGGASGVYAGGGGSGYFATGELLAGTYNVIIGAGGSGGDGSATSINGVTANGGGVAVGNQGGAGGSGGASQYGVGGQNGGNGTGGTPGAGSGVSVQGFIPGTGGARGSTNTPQGGYGGGLYAGGGGTSGGQNGTGNQNGQNYGGGAGGGVNTVTGFQGVVLVVQGF